MKGYGWVGPLFEFLFDFFCVLAEVAQFGLHRPGFDIFIYTHIYTRAGVVVCVC